MSNEVSVSLCPDVRKLWIRARPHCLPIAFANFIHLLHVLVSHKYYVSIRQEGLSVTFARVKQPHDLKISNIYHCS